MSPRAVRICLWSGLGAALTACAYLLISTTFMPYDDEGYVLISIRNYLAGLPLYREVFSQYGPWPFVYHELVTTITGLPLTHGLGRGLTLLHWVTASLLCGVMGWRLTRSQVAAVTTSLLTFSLCWQNISEPSHPGSHLMLLIALAAAIVTGLPSSRHPRPAYAFLGIISGLVLLTKINVGLLLVAGLGALLLLETAWPARWLPTTRGLAAAGILALPWVLMGRQLGLDWALTFALLFTAAAVAIGWVTPTSSDGLKLPPFAWLVLPIGLIATSGIIVGRITIHGTPVSALLDAVLISPLRMPAHFMVGLRWYPEVWALALTSAGITFRAGFEIRRRGRLSPTTLGLVVVSRLGALLLFVLLARYWPSHEGIFHFAAYCLPLLPLFLIPLAASPDAERQAASRGLACLALPQILHAFPVAGSQLAWATFLCVPVFVAGIHEAKLTLPALLPTAGRRLGDAVSATALGAALFVLGLMSHTGWQRYSQSRPLELPGSGDIRLDGKTRQAFRLLHLNAIIHADLLFSRQGMFSHNLWSGIPTPTAQNATHWFWLLNEPQQRKIIARLAATPRTALITSQSLDEFMLKNNIPVGGSLQDFVSGYYQPLFRYADFTFHVPVDSGAVVFGRYELLEGVGQDGTLLFRTNLLLDGTPAQIRMEQMNFPWEPGPALLGPGLRGQAEPIDREGRTLGPPVPLPGDRTLRGLYRISLVIPRLPPDLPWQEYLVKVRDKEGNLLGEAVH